MARYFTSKRKEWNIARKEWTTARQTLSRTNIKFCSPFPAFETHDVIVWAPKGLGSSIPSTLLPTPPVEPYWDQSQSLPTLLGRPLTSMASPSP